MPAAPFACAGCGAEFAAALRWPVPAPHGGVCPQCGAVLIRTELPVLEVDEGGSGAGEVAYDLAAWDPSDRDRLVVLLADRGIRSRWDDDDQLSVGLVDEGPVDALCDIIESAPAADSPPPLDAISDDEVWARLDALAVCCRKVLEAKTVGDLLAAELDEAATLVSNSPSPTGAEDDVWTDVQAANDELLDAVAADELDDDLLTERAHAVLDLLPE